jgi:general secretion pathway protein K
MIKHNATNRRNNFGAALLSAMLTVTLVATFAAAALWQQWRSVEVEIAERGRVQTATLLIGALDWTRLILRNNGRKASTDNLTQAWASPLKESRISDFLAADKNNTGGLTAEEQVNVFLSGRMVDAQSKLNVHNLIDNGAVSVVYKAAFKKLFTHLNLPQTELDTFANNLQKTLSPAHLPTASLMPERVRQLTWLGLSAATLTKLTPFITILPTPSITTTVNINTAPAEVILAIVPNLQLADAKNVVFTRASKYFESLQEAEKTLPALAGNLPSNLISVSTEFFEVTGHLRIEETIVEVQSLIDRRDISNLKTVWLERAVVATPAVPATP